MLRHSPLLLPLPNGLLPEYVQGMLYAYNRRFSTACVPVHGLENEWVRLMMEIGATVLGIVVWSAVFTGGIEGEGDVAVGAVILPEGFESCGTGVVGVLKLSKRLGFVESLRACVWIYITRIYSLSIPKTVDHRSWAGGSRAFHFSLFLRIVNTSVDIFVAIKLVVLNIVRHLCWCEGFRIYLVWAVRVANGVSNLGEMHWSVWLFWSKVFCAPEPFFSITRTVELEIPVFRLSNSIHRCLLGSLIAELNIHLGVG